MLTDKQRTIQGYIEQGKLVPDDTSKDDLQALAAYYIDSKQDVKAIICFNEITRLKL